MHKEIRDILDIFTEINIIPRQSKHEKQISDRLMAWAEMNGLSAERDKLLNVLIHVPPTPGYEAKPTVVLQGHMDMVCEKTPDSPHDFSKDPVKVLIDGEWVHADKTTLGADNAIALAMAMKIAVDTAIEHPELELLFTVDEETGLTGANGLSSDFIKGKILLNIDSEDDKKFTIGCAGGRDTTLSFPVEYRPFPESYSLFKISVSGLTGGHSGSDIHKGRANANKILGRVLDRLEKKGHIYLVSLSGGSAHNAIPRDAEAFLALPGMNSAPLSQIESFIRDLRHEYEATDANLSVLCEKISKTADQVLTRNLTKKIIHTLLALPHGVAAMSSDIPGLVETSNNLATIKTDSNKITILTSQRSSVMSRLDAITRRIESVGFLSGSEVRTGNGYPSWQPDMNSKLLKKCKEVYRKVHGEEPVIEVIHAGLECGVIGAKYDGMEMISFGPLILDAHSPDERMSLPSLEKVWRFTKRLLKEI